MIFGKHTKHIISVMQWVVALMENQALRLQGTFSFHILNSPINLHIFDQTE